MNNLEIGQNLQKIRRAAKMSQAELAKIFECNQAVISRIENGNRPLSLGQMVQISEIFGVSSDLFICGKINFWKIAERFGQQPPIPKKYLVDQSAHIREILPLWLFLKTTLGEVKALNFFEQFKTDSLPFQDPDQRISRLLVLDLFRKAINQKVLTPQKYHLYVKHSHLAPVHLGLADVYKSMPSPLHLIQSWLNHSHLYDSLFEYDIQELTPGHIVFDVSQKEWKEEDQIDPNVENFLVNTRERFIQSLPKAFGMKEIEFKKLNPSSSPSTKATYSLVS